jgi:lipopolysaccharide transport system ATP-binding protein
MSRIIEVSHLSKKFCSDLKRSMLYGIKDIAREILGRGRKSDILRPKEFWALKDVSFSVDRGESVGLIGANGAGKSTLLRIISGLIKPDAGTVHVKGPVAPLIALGAGFNPILTGRENVFVNMAILGLSQQEIKSKFDEVVDFSGLEHALDMPVQTYSSGMAARLGFSCAIFTRPDILLIDEVLAVGDLKFRAKCYRKLADLKKSGITFIMVSHSPQAILSICDVGMFLKKGVLMSIGSTNDVMSQYEADLASDEPENVSGFTAGKLENVDFSIRKIHFENDNHVEVKTVETGRPANLILEFNAFRPFDNLTIQIIISDSSLHSERTLFLSNAIDKVKITALEQSSRVRVHLPTLGLNPGVYSMKVAVYQDELYLLDVVEAFRFIVWSEFPSHQSLYHQPRKWIADEETQI